MALSFVERVQLQRAAEQSSRPFRDLPGDRPGNPNLLFRVRRANLFPRQLKLVTVKATWRDQGRPKPTRSPRRPSQSSPQLPLFAHLAAGG